MLVDVSKRLLSATRRGNTSLFRYGAVLSQAARRLAAFISSLVLRTVEFLFYHQCSPGAEIRGIWLSAFRPSSGIACGAPGCNPIRWFGDREAVAKGGFGSRR